MITIKQERFVQEYLKVGNASEAYRTAYNAEKMLPATVNRKAVELLNNGKITAMIDELRTKIENEAIADATVRRIFWTKVMKDEQVAMKDRLRASELLGKADGDFVVRVEQEAKVEYSSCLDDFYEGRPQSKSPRVLGRKREE